MLKLHSKGSLVKELQMLLTERGFDTKGIDGIFGNNTRSAVIAFQIKNNLTPDGIVGTLTMKCLKLSNLSDAYDIALGEIGVKEIPGIKNNGRIIQYFAKTKNEWATDEDISWCAAFVGFCLETVGIKSSRALNARSYLTWGKETKNPKLGDIVVFSRGNNQSLGHVAFFDKDNGDHISVLGGNQNDSVCFASYPKSMVLSYRTFD